MPRPFREYALTLALLAATLAVTFYPVIFEDRTLLPSDMIDTMTLPFSQYYGPPHAFNSLITDGYLQFYPLKYFTKQAYEHGNFAFWNPYILNGYPQYLEGMWTYNFVLFLPLAIAFPLILLLPLLVAGIGFYALLREYSVRPGIARIFATAYMLNALFMTHLLAHFIPASFSFAPFVLLFLHKYVRVPQFKYLAASSITLALGFLAGNLQTIGFLSFFTICYWAALWSLDRPRSLTRLLKPLAIVLGFAIGLSMILILPTLELFHEAMTSGAVFSTSLLRSYDIFQRMMSLGLAFTFFIPQLVGSIRGVTLHQMVGVYAQDFEGAIGFIPLLIALWASFALWRRMPQVRPFVILMIAGFALPIATPLFRFIYHRFMILFVFGACGAGALGFEALLSNDVWTASLRKWTKGFTYGLLGAIAILAFCSILRAVDFSTMERFATTHLLPRLHSAVFAEGNAGWVRDRFAEALDYWRLTRSEILIGLATSILGLLVLQWRAKFHPSALLVAIWGITVIQLVFFARCWFPSNDLGRYPLYPETPETKLLRAQQSDTRTFIYRELDPSKQFVFLNNQNILYGIHEATGYESVIPRCLYAYTAVGHASHAGTLGSQFLGKFNAGTLAAQHPLSDDSLLQIGSIGPLWIYRNQRVTQRAFFAYTSSILPNDIKVMDRLLDSVGPWPAAFFTPDDRAIPLHASPSSDDSIVFIENHENEALLRTSTQDSAYLVLTDTYYPGWTCTVDGKNAKVLRCNYAMRAVLLGAGEHRIRFAFLPLTFRIGSLTSCVSLILLLATLAWSKRER